MRSTTHRQGSLSHWWGLIFSEISTSRSSCCFKSDQATIDYLTQENAGLKEKVRDEKCIQKQIASYTGTSSTRSATGYTVTASYTGQVAKTDCEVVTYTAIFGSVELAEDEKDAQESSQPESPAPDADPDGGGVALLPILGCVGGVAAVAAVAVWAIQTKRGRRSRT